MNIDDQRLDDEANDDLEPIPVPENPTVKDLIDAVDTLADEDQHDAFYAELYDNLGDDVSRQLWDIRGETAAATVRVLAGIPIEELVGDLPITIVPRQDFEQLLALERAKVARQVEPAKPIEELDRDRALERIAQIFSDVGAGDLPPNEQWSLALQEAKSAVPIIVAARRLGAPEEYSRRLAREHVKTFVVGHERNRNAQLLNFGVIARFLKNMQFGSDDDVAFFEALASGGK